jgi:hypothetical protein
MKVLAAFLVIGMAVPAMAAPEGGAGKPAKERAICKRDYASQTRLGAKVCRPAEEKRVKAAPAPAPAGTAAPVQVASATTVTVPGPKKEKKICKRQESSTSRLGAGPKVCMTVAEWRRRNGEPAQDDSEKLLMNQGTGR